MQDAAENLVRPFFVVLGQVDIFLTFCWHPVLCSVYICEGSNTGPGKITIYRKAEEDIEMESLNVNMIRKLLRVLVKSLGIAVMQFMFYVAFDMLFFTQASLAETVMNPISICFGLMFFIFSFFPACRREGIFQKMHG